MIDLTTAAIGTAHPAATCGWCGSPLVVGQVEQLRCWLCPKDYGRQTQYALLVDYTKAQAHQLGLKGAGRYCWHVPLPSQVAPYEIREDYPVYLLWGGQAGPGKSTGSRHWLYWRALRIPGYEGLLLRENWDMLRDNHTTKMAVEVPRLGGVWREGDRMAVFGRGSDQAVIRCGHMADADAITRYLGIEYDDIVGDEGTLYPIGTDGVSIFSQLLPRARKTHRTTDGQTGAGIGVIPTNPGGPSAPWLKDMCIDHEPDFAASPQLRPKYDANGKQVGGYFGERWRYLPATLDDNPYMREDYRDTDLAMHGEVRYKQLAEGDWSVFSGQFFPEWQTSVHVASMALEAAA